MDTSALLQALIGADPAVLERLAGDGDLHAPHLLDVEVLDALRRLVRSGQLGEDRANDALADLRDLAIMRYPHEPLMERMWELRHDLSAHEAAFVALAEGLGMLLVTCDARLAAAPGVGATVEVLGTAG
ncbi:type II toxin-antitoxin system VapC family toxin [Paraconexibacter sp. AEG42_29]|uniref:type II toxin-antitoxin system VapC family toxin n=1 Tax=Paraconexibacter sp. AEG42_29 TaxID=2997339 RepID=UPI00339D959D